ncbi:lysosomal acid phosphatase [Spea bombifrons]|uniref:lysosomal acid phosphatase n=1 Tax=Spea bombifrons TaxID=233779 RepID=UPI00234B8CEC|nr:lysosomal acid phosphatase [Spea bombifrons]
MATGRCPSSGSPLRIIPVLLGLVLVTAPLAQARQLRFVTLVYRHGDRSPVKTYPNDAHRESAWPQGFGQLTQIGMRQHWDLGQELRHRYKGFLNESYSRHEIYVRSTDIDRTLMSAEANLAGLYPPAGSQVFNPNISWQPIPVDTVPDSRDRLLKYPILPCPKYLQLQEETRHSSEYIKKTKDNLEFLQMVANETGLSDCSLESVWSISDILFCEKTHNMSLPSWATPEVRARLSDLKDFSFRFLFGIHKQVQKARLQGGVLVHQILKNMAAAHNTSNELKLIAYSAHDTTVGALQMALDVYNGKQAPYASCHIFELFEEGPGNFTVEMYFRNESGNPPYPLTLPGCDHTCPFQDFQRLLQPVIAENWEKECQIGDTTSDTRVIIGLVACGCILLLLVALLLTVLLRQKSQPAGYHHVSDALEEQT